jgi:exopolysaccharide biosynthesis polyprenyl glycosylphosphotransferase
LQTTYLTRHHSMWQRAAWRGTGFHRLVVGWASQMQRTDEALADRPQSAWSVVSPPDDATRRRGRLTASSEYLGVALSFAIGFLVARAYTQPSGEALGFWLFLYTPVFAIAFRLCGGFERRRRQLVSADLVETGRLLLALAFGGAAMIVLSRLLYNAANVGPRLAFASVVAVTVPAAFTVPLSRAVVSFARRRSGHVRSRVVILGSGSVVDSLAGRLARVADIELLGCVDDTNTFDHARRDLRLLGSVADLPELCSTCDVDRILVGFGATGVPEVLESLRQLPPSVRVSVVPRFFDLVTWRSKVADFDGLSVIDIAPPGFTATQRLLKRAVDIVGASVALILLLPLFSVVAVLIKVTSPGPVLFKQLRTGRRGEPFWIYKLRTMRVGAESEQQLLSVDNEIDGPIFKIRDDPRATKIGRLLRKTSLDEVPQLINVLKGEMSLVGPRPFPVAESEQIDGWAARRFDVRPGMTGLWQVSGRNDLPFDELRRLDYGYVASWSIWWDLKILWQTPRCVLRREGAY